MDLGLKRPIILKDSAPSCPHCEAMGWRFQAGDTSLWQAFLELSLWENVEEFVFSMDSILHSEWTFLTDQARARGFKISIWNCGHSGHAKAVQQQVEFAGVNRVYTLVSNSLELSRARECVTQPGPLYLCFHENTKRTTLKLFEKELRQDLFPVWAVFPERNDTRGTGLTGKTLHSLFYSTRGRRLGQGLQAMPGLEMMDVRREIRESMVPTDVHTFVMEAKPVFSFVIPAFGEEADLVQVLDRLLLLNDKRFELVLVDEGNPRSLFNLFLSYIERGLQGTYLRLDWRAELGAKPFRAGRARNLGAKHARGEILCFLDSDILVSNNYLTEVEEGLRSADAVQAIREEFLKDGSPAKNIYWEKFRSSASLNWNAIKHPWKYICTHSLSLRRSLFIESGGFSSLFNSYGYEDTDLGYRLFLRGNLFKLLKTPVRHLVREDEYIQHKQNHSIRLQSLHRTAGFFMRNHWDQEVFAHLHYLFDVRRSQWTKINAVGKDFLAWLGVQSRIP